MRIIASVLLVFCALSLSAQQEIVFKALYQPEKVYNLSLLTVMQGEMNFEGDEEILEEIVESGMVLPIKMEGINEVEFTIRTFARGDDGMMPATLTYDKVRVMMQMLGKGEGGDSPLTGFVINGRFDSEGKFTIDSVPGLGEELRLEDIRNMVNQLQESIKFPERPLKEGDSFTISIPVSIPLASMSSLSMEMETVYTIREIKDGLANLGIGMDLRIGGAVETMEVVATGNGSGVAVYDIHETQITNSEISFQIESKMDIQGLSMTFKMENKVTQTIGIR